MTEPENLDPGTQDQNFNEGLETGYDIASQETQEQIADALEDAGFNPDDIEEALYDPAPRRGHRRGRRSARRSYDPTPTRRRRSRKGSKKGGKRRAKGTLGKLKKWAMPVAAAGTFLAAYNTRATALGMSIPDAIMKDIKEFDANAAMTRLQNNVTNIGLPAVAGFAIKETHIAGKYSPLIGDIMYGIAAGLLGKTILDPPINGDGRSVRTNNTGRQTITVTPGNAGNVASQVQTTAGFSFPSAYSGR